MKRDLPQIKREASRRADEIARRTHRILHAQPRFPILLFFSLVVGEIFGVRFEKPLHLSFTNLDVAKAWYRGHLIPV